MCQSKCTCTIDTANTHVETYADPCEFCIAQYEAELKLVDERRKQGKCWGCGQANTNGLCNDCAYHNSQVVQQHMEKQAAHNAYCSAMAGVPYQA